MCALAAGVGACVQGLLNEAILKYFFFLVEKCFSDLNGKILSDSSAQRVMSRLWVHTSAD